MGNPLRFFIPFMLVLVALTFTSSTNAVGPVMQECNTAKTQTVIVDCNLESPSSCSVIYLPQQTSGANIIRMHGSAKRTSNAHRNNVGFHVACKSTNAGTGNFIKKESLNIRYFVAEPACMLISLGKLII